MISTYCGSMTQAEFRKHIRECGICWLDAQGRFFNLEFDPSAIRQPNSTQNDDVAGPTKP